MQPLPPELPPGPPVSEPHRGGHASQWLAHPLAGPSGARRRSTRLGHCRPRRGTRPARDPRSASARFRTPPLGRATADPWTGTRKLETRQEHWQWSKGPLIGINRKRMLGHQTAREGSLRNF